jgi:hypothetical protein
VHACCGPDRAIDGLFYPPQRTGLEQHLGVGIAAHGTPGVAKLLADVAIIVDLAVEGDDVTTIGRVHGLGTARAQIDDRESALAEHDPDLGLDPSGTGIRTAMPLRLVHCFADRP